MDIYYVAQDAVTSQVTDAAVFPNDLSGPLIFVPELQREDGSYIGSDRGLDYVMAMGAGGGILWQYQTGSHFTQDVPARPLYATADGGVILTTSVKDCDPGDTTLNTLLTEDCISQDGALPGDSNYGQLGTIYTLDQNGNPAADANGNPIPPTPDTGIAYSWKGAYSVSGDPVLASLSSAIPPLATTFAAVRNGNLTGNGFSLIHHSFGLIFCNTGTGGDGQCTSAIQNDNMTFSYLPGTWPAYLAGTLLSQTNYTHACDFSQASACDNNMAHPEWVSDVKIQALNALKAAFTNLPAIVQSGDAPNMLYGGTSTKPFFEHTVYVNGEWENETGLTQIGVTSYSWVFYPNILSAAETNLGDFNKAQFIYFVPAFMDTANMLKLIKALGKGIGNSAAHEIGWELSVPTSTNKYPVGQMGCSAATCENTYESDGPDPWKFIDSNPPIHWLPTNQCNLTRYLRNSNSCTSN